MVKASFKTETSGAAQFVVQLALETTSFVSPGASRNLCVFTPQTKVSASLLGAEMTTRFAPASVCVGKYLQVL
jgi:hypothetical protein